MTEPIEDPAWDINTPVGDGTPAEGDPHGYEYEYDYYGDPIDVEK